MTTIITAAEMLDTEVLKDKSPRVQLILYPFVGLNITEVFNGHFTSRADTVDFIIEDDRVVFLSNPATGEKQVLYTVSEDSTVYLDYLDGSLLKISDDVIDVRVIPADSFTTAGIGSVTHDTSTRDLLVRPVEFTGDHVAFQSASKNSTTDNFSAFSVVLSGGKSDSFDSHFNTLEGVMMMYLPEGYTLTNDEYLVVRTKRYCFMLDNKADKLFFVGVYKEEFLELTQVLVSATDVEKERIEDNQPDEDDIREQLYDTLKLCRDNDISMETVVCETVNVYKRFCF